MLRTASTRHPDPGVHPNVDPDELHPTRVFFFVIHVPEYCTDAQYLNFSEKSENSKFYLFGGVMVSATPFSYKDNLLPGNGSV